MKHRNPQVIKHRTISRFRGMAVAAMGAILPEHFVNACQNMVSPIMGQLEKRAGASRRGGSWAFETAGDINMQGSHNSGQLVGVGACVYAQAESGPVQLPTDEWT